MTAETDKKTELYMRFQEKVLHYLYAQTGDRTLAEDLCANVFLKAYEKWEQYDAEKSSCSTWLYTITRNTLTDYFRTRRVFEPIPEELADGSLIEEELCNREMLERLAEALETLDERERDIIVLHYYSNRTLTEIARQMQLSYTYVKVLHNKALSLLRKSF